MSDIRVTVTHADAIEENDVIWIDPIGFRKITRRLLGPKVEGKVGLFWAAREGAILPIGQTVLKQVS